MAGETVRDFAGLIGIDGDRFSIALPFITTCPWVTVSTPDSSGCAARAR
jgi:hypothetical protein